MRHFAWQAWHFATVTGAIVTICYNSCASFQNIIHCLWQAQHFGRVHLVFRGRRGALDVWCRAFFFANRIVTAASSGDNVHIAWQAWDIVRVSFCLAGVVFRADPSCVESHLARQAQYLGHFGTLYTLHPTLYTLHFTLYTCHSPLYTLHF